MEPKREQSGGRGGPSWGGVRCQTRGSEASDSTGLRAVLRLRHSVGMCRGSKFSEGLSTLLAPAPSIRITWEFYNHSRCSAQPEIQTQCLNICIFNKPPQAPLPQFISSAGDQKPRSRCEGSSPSGLPGPIPESPLVPPFSGGWRPTCRGVSLPPHSS